MTRPLFALAVVALLAECGDLGCTPGWNDPPRPGPGQPCNELEVSCPTQHGCCPRGQTCGGEPASVGCPAGMCCPIGPGWQATRSDGGAPHGATPMRR
jgi:hypothetical protein